jgi:ribosome-associated protein
VGLAERAQQVLHGGPVVEAELQPRPPGELRQPGDEAHANLHCAADPTLVGMDHEVHLRGDTIRLGQLLKATGMVDAGGDVRAFLATVPVLVNGEPEDRRGRQLHAGDEVRAGDELVRVTGPRS